MYHLTVCFFSLCSVLDQLIEDFLTEKNEEIVEHNERVGSKVMFP